MGSICLVDKERGPHLPTCSMELNSIFFDDLESWEKQIEDPFVLLCQLYNKSSVYQNRTNKKKFEIKTELEINRAIDFLEKNYNQEKKLQLKINY